MKNQKGEYLKSNECALSVAAAAATAAAATAAPAS